MAVLQTEVLKHISILCDLVFKPNMYILGHCYWLPWTLQRKAAYKYSNKIQNVSLFLKWIYQTKSQLPDYLQLHNVHILTLLLLLLKAKQMQKSVFVSTELGWKYGPSFLLSPLHRKTHFLGKSDQQ